MKKIISAAAIALAASMIVASPANAVPTISVTNGAGSSVTTTASTATTPATATVPSDNKVDAADAVTFEMTGIDTGTVVSVVATNASIVTALHNPAGTAVTASAGAASYSVNTGTGTTAKFYVFSKTTATGTVVITNGGNTWTYYVKGIAGPAYNLAVSLATVGATSAVLEGTATVTDVFGNKIAAVYSVSAINATVTGVDTTSATTGADVFSVTLPATAGTTALQFKIVATDVDGFAKAVSTVDKFITVSDLAVVNATLVAQNKALTDELAAVKSELASEKAAHTATKSESARLAGALATTEKAVADLNAKVEVANAYVAKLKVWIGKLKAQLKLARSK